MLRPGEVLIHDGNAQEFIGMDVDGERKSWGLIPRPMKAYPPGYYKAAPAAVDIPLIPASERSERIKDKIAAKSQISDIRMVGNGGQPIPALDQNGKGYCWAHSSTSALTMLRALQNQPYVPLSAYAIACIIKSYRDEGGWGAQSLDFITERGVPSSAFWPMQSMDKSNDKPETWANAALHKTTEGWIDTSSQQYDRKLSFDQVSSLLLSNVPVVSDFNWWSHSVCAIDLVDGTGQRMATRAESGKLATTKQFEEMWGINDPVTAGLGIRILNSWGDSWSDHGMGTLTGSKAIPDGSVAPRVTGASAA